PADREALLAFHKQVGELQRAVMGASRAAQDAAERMEGIKRAIDISPQVDLGLRDEARSLELRLMDVRERLTGDRTRPRRSEPGMPGITSRLQRVVSAGFSSTSAPTETQRQGYEIAAEEFGEIYDDLRQLVETDLPAFEARLEAAGVPWTPGRSIPRWNRG
ncbi:MAG: glycosyl hydrolase, partial [Gemmatimonadales bacterium]|nr:glycosyl hydrolase [Gemmatimonadales bacterium]